MVLALAVELQYTSVNQWCHTTNSSHSLATLNWHGRFRVGIKIVYHQSAWHHALQPGKQALPSAHNSSTCARKLN
jgi:hypothetical protein